MSEDARENYDETYQNYRRYVNPSLARVMKLAGSVVESHAQGSTVWDHQGKQYLDFAGGYGVFTLGHRHPRVVAAVETQLALMGLATKTMFTPALGLLAKRLAEDTPGALEISFVSNSGTEAIEAALKLARAATNRTHFLATWGAYHGKTFGALSVSGRERYQAPFAPLLPDVLHVPYDDVAAMRAAFVAHPQQIAACVVEPIQGEGGIIVPHDGYLTALRALCDEFGALLIFDEVQTGLGRCGYRFACEHEGVVPDIMTLAKGLSGGIMPIGACISTRAVWEAGYKHEPLLHTSTFGGNPLACAAALEALAVLEEEDLASNARVRGQQLLLGLQQIAQAWPDIIAQVRGRGLLIGVELTHEGYAGVLLPEMLKHGIIVAWTLNQQRVLRFEPPLIITEAEVTRCLEVVALALATARERFGSSLLS